MKALLSFLALAVLTACTQGSPAPPTQTSIVIGTVYGGQTWDLVGRALADAYTRTVPNVRATTEATENLEQHVDSLESRKIDLAIEDAETAYLAYSAGTARQPQPHRSLRAISVLFSTAVQVVARRAAGIDAIAQLKGRRVFTGSEGTPTRRAARLILSSHGVEWEQVQPMAGQPGSAAALRSGAADAIFVYSPFRNTLVAGLIEDGVGQLVPLDAKNIGVIQEGHHFLKSTIIPRGTYLGEPRDVLTVGMDVLLLCREDLPEELVYHLSKALFASVPQLTAAHAAASGISPDRGPATTIPLHPGAARFYREREILR